MSDYRSLMLSKLVSNVMINFNLHVDNISNLQTIPFMRNIYCDELVTVFNRAF